MRVLTSPADTGAVVISLPQDIQSHAYDFPVEFFEPAGLEDPPSAARPRRDRAGRRAHPGGSTAGADRRRRYPLLRCLRRAGGGSPRRSVSRCWRPSPVRARSPATAWWQVGGVGLEGNFASNNVLVKQADLVISVGTRLTDFATGFAVGLRERHGAVRVAERGGRRYPQAGRGRHPRPTPALGLAALTAALDGHTTSAVLARRRSRPPRPTGRRSAPRRWTRMSRSRVRITRPRRAPVTDAVLTQAQLVGLMQEHARSGDTIIAAAGSAPGDLQKVWDATDNRHCHLEFGFSCMGYELPAGDGGAPGRGRQRHPDRRRSSVTAPT